MRIGFTSVLGKSIEDDIKFCAKGGFDYYELDFGFHQPSEVKDISLLQILGASDMIKFTTHAQWYLPDATVIEKIRKASVDVIKEDILFAREIGATRLCFHAGVREFPQFMDESCLDAFCKFISEIIDSKGIELAIENSPMSTISLCHLERHFDYLFAKFPQLKMVLDIGHQFTVTHEVLSFYKKFKDRIVEIHIHDNDGLVDEHKAIGDGKIDYTLLFAQLKKDGWDGDITIETFPYEGIEKSFEKLQMMLHE